MLRRTLAAVMVFATLLGLAGHAGASAESEAAADATPPRLSYTTGSVSFWRPGGDDWAPAQVNTPLAEGDELYTSRDGNLEVQVGGQAFVRAWGDSQLALTRHDPSFVQLRVTAGHVALDLRSVDPGDVLEIDTPAAAFTIDQPGYYRVDVAGERTSFVTRRSGRASLTTAEGPGGAIAPGEAVILEGGTVRRLAAAEPDVWDRWNDARTAALVAPVSARYVPPQVYGTDELERHGAWRSDPTYGSVWVPAGVAADWAPYSSGRWIWDPRFGWTWLDTASWGWAPYHYGRWVSLGGRWAWAPGPIVVRPAYAPALVAFFGSPAIDGPSIGWVALGWGEPVVPWWGRTGFVGRPWWGGWGGPRVHQVTVHRNVTVVNAVVVVRSDHFGRGAVRDGRIARPDVGRLRPVHGRLDVKPDAVSFRGAGGHAQRPPEDQVRRRVVFSRPPAARPEPPVGRDDRRDARPGVGRDGERDPRPGDRPRTIDTPRADRPRGDDRRPDAPRREAPRAETPRVDTPRAEPRVETPRRPDAPRVETPRVVEPRRPEIPRVDTPRAEPRVDTPRRPEVPRVDTPRPEPRVETPRRVDAPRVETPRVVEPRRPETPRVEAPRPEPRVDTPRRPEVPRVDAPRRVETPPVVEPRRPEIPWVDTPRPEPRRQDVPRVEPPRVEAPRPEPRRSEAPRVEMRRPEPPRAEAPRVEAPRRAAAPDAGRRPEAVHPAVQHRPAAAPRVPPARPGDGRAKDERGRQGR